MIHEKTSLEVWLDEQARTASLTYDLTAYSLLMTDAGLKIQLQGALFFPLKRRLFGNFHVLSSESPEPISLSDLPVSFTLAPVGSDVERPATIGFLQYFPAMKTDDGVVDEAPQIESTIVIAESALDQMGNFLSTKPGPWKASLAIDGIERSKNGDIHWNTDNVIKLPITSFALVLQEVAIPGKSIETVDAEIRSALAEIQESLIKIGAKLNSGVRIRLFPS